jgi:hypothetical protein
MAKRNSTPPNGKRRRAPKPPSVATEPTAAELRQAARTLLEALVWIGADDDDGWPELRARVGRLKEQGVRI